MKKLRKLLALLLVLSLVAALSACGGPDPLIGTWVGEVDLRDELVESLDEAFEGQGGPSAADYISSLTLTLTLEFREDGTFSRSYDLSKDKDSFVTGCAAFMRDMISAIVGMEVDDAAAAQALGMPLEDYALSVLDSMVEAMESDGGSYKSDGKKITWNDEINPYSIEGDVMTMRTSDIGSITFHRVG